MAFDRLSTEQAVAWLRQKTRTASTPADQIGEWTDADMIDALNHGLREIVTRMLTTPWASYFLAIDLNQPTTNGVLVVGIGTTKQYAAIKVAYVRGSVAAGDLAGMLIPQMSLNRLITTINTQNPDGGMLKVGSKLFYVVTGSGHDSGLPILALQLFNNGSEIPLDVTYYSYPSQLTAVASNQYVGLPAIAWNALLSYTLMLLCEDDRNMELRSLARERFEAEYQMLLLAAPQSYDMPDNLLAPADRQQL